MATTDTETGQLQLITLDPTTIRTTDQIRQNATPDQSLVESVTANGILQPPTVIWNDAEQAHVLVFGARRVGAAIIAGLTEIPVLVTDPATLTEAGILERQIVENERREAVAPADLARGWARLESLFGETIEDIAARTGEKPERVAAGIRTARSEKAAAILATTPTLDLEKAAQLTEFDEHPTIQRELAEVAVDRPENFDWKLRAARDKIAKDTRTAELKAEIKAAKVKLAKTDTYGTLPRGTADLSNLYTPAGKKLNARTHAKCPGHAAHVAGFRAEDLKIEYVCVGYETHGHTYGHHQPTELTDQQKQEKAEREAHAAAVTANRAARRQWIHDLLPGKINQLPGVYDYMAAALLTFEYYNDQRAPKITLTLLDIHFTTEHMNRAGEILDELVASKRIAPFRLMLATALGAHERALEQGHDETTIIRHYTQLERWGYQLTDIDQPALTAAHERLAARTHDEALEAAGENLTTDGEGHDNEDGDDQ